MQIIELNDENISEYTQYVGEDMAENLERTFYRGFLVMSDAGDDMLSGIIWEYHNYDEDTDTESFIEWIKINDPEAADTLFDEYTKRIKAEAVVKSHFVIPVKDRKVEKEALKKAGFTARLTEGDNIIVELSELSALPIMKSRAVPPNISVISDLTLRKFRKGIYQCVTKGKKGLCQDLSFLQMSWFDADVSCYAKGEEDTITGFFLFHKLPSGMMSIQLMIGLDKNAQQNLLGMIRKFIISMEENYPPETKILLNRHTQASLQLTEKLLPRGFGIPVYAGVREE